MVEFGTQFWNQPCNHRRYLMIRILKAFCHSREGGNLYQINNSRKKIISHASVSKSWIPAFAGMTGIRCFYLIIFFVIFNSFVFAENYVKINPSSKYGKEEELFFKESMDKYLSLNLSNDTQSVNSLNSVNDETIDDVIKNLDTFLLNYPNHEFTARIYYILGECYFLKAISIYKNIGFLSENVKSIFATAIENYNKILNMPDVNNFFKENAEYRIIECSFAMGDLKNTLKLAENYKYNYLISDVFYIFGITYIKNFKQTFDQALDNANLDVIKNVLDNIGITEENKEKILMAIGITNFIKKDYKEAIENFDFQKVNSDDSLYYLGKAYEKTDQYILAIGKYRDLIQNYADSKYARKALISIGDTFYKLKDYKSSIDAFSEYISKYKDDDYISYSNYKIACSYFSIKEYTSAIEYYQKVLTSKISSEIKNLDAYSLYLIAYSYYKLNQYKESANAFIKCGENFPNTAQGLKSLFMTAWCFYTINDLDKAEFFLIKATKSILVDNEISIHMYYLLANIQYDKKNYENALKNYQLVVDKITSNNLVNLNDLRDEAFFMLNYISYMQENFVRIASEFQYSLYKICPQIDKKTTRVNTYFLVADACYRIKYFKEAKSLFSKISNEYVEHDVIYSKALDGLAWCEFDENNYLKAEQIRKIISDIAANTNKDLGDLKTLNSYELGNIYLTKKDFVNAIENYEYFVKNSTSEEYKPKALYRLGMAYYREEYYSTAIDKWKEILKNYPKYEKTLFVAYKIADTYYKSGKYPDAINSFQYILDKFDASIQEVMESALRIPQCYFNDKKYDMAITKFRDFIIKYPDSEKTKEAIDLIETTISRKKEYNAYLKGLKTAEILIAKDFTDVFRDFVESKKDLAVTTEIVYRIGFHNYEEGNYAEAFFWFNKFFALGNYSTFDTKKIANAQYSLAESAYLLGKYDDSAKNYEILITNFKNFEYIEKAYVRLGTASLNIKDYAKSVKAYLGLLENYPKSEYVRIAKYNMGIAYKELGEIEKSCLAFVDYYNMAPEDESSIQIMIEVGDTYSKRRDYEKSISIFTHILVYLEGEQRIYAQYKIAECYEKQFNYDLSIDEYVKLLDMEPKNSTTRLTGLIRLCDLYKNKNLPNEAYSIYKEILNNTNNKQWIEAIKARLEELDMAKTEKQI
jgi:tetratricopeptide (TPR) repeat protein